MNDSITKAIYCAERIYKEDLNDHGTRHIDEAVAVLKSLFEGIGSSVRCAALLSRVLEKNEMAPEDLLNIGMTNETIRLIIEVTRYPDESIEMFLQRIARHGTPGARLIIEARLLDSIRRKGRYPLDFPLNDRETLLFTKVYPATLKAFKYRSAIHNLQTLKPEVIYG